MRNFTLAAVLAAAAAVGLADSAKAQLVVSVGGGGIYPAGGIYPGGGLAYTSGYGYGFSPYGYSGVYPAGYTLGRSYGLYSYPAYTYGSYYSYPGYYSSGYYGGSYYRPHYYGRGWRRW